MADAKFDLKHFVPPGPVGAAFLVSTSPISIIMGPAGSGKTVASAFRGPVLADMVAPICRDGVIRVKQATIRDTYRDLARTCLASWHEFFPPDGPLTKAGGYEGGQDRPIKHTLSWETIRDGCRIPVEFIMQFGAIGDANIESFIKGYELTFGWMNECDLLDERVPGLLLQRTGRYPRVADIHPLELKRLKPMVEQQFADMGAEFKADDVGLPRMIWGDMNPPDIGHWTYKRMVKEKTPGYRLFKQPGGLTREAENRSGKPRASYELEARTMNEYDVRRYVHGEFGWSRDGKPVYPEFRENEMVADQPIKPIPGLPLGLGLDAGGSPACGIGQFIPNGQLRMLREICCDPGTGPSRFSEMILEILMSEFRGFAVSEAWGDPAAYMGADRINGELAYMETVARAINVNISPTSTNEAGIRHEAVRWYLGAPIEASVPRLLIDPRCERTIGGFAAHYKLTKQATSGATDKLVVAKNEYSHIHDGWQYLCLGHRGRPTVIRDGAQLGRGGNVVSIRQHTAKTDFDVFSV